MNKDHVDGVHQLLTTYLAKNFKLHVNFTVDDVAHWLLPREKVIDTYVLVNAEGAVTDMVSYYHLPSTILGQDDTLHAAYSYYNVATSMSLEELMTDALILANSTGSDVFNALNLMENEKILEELKFGRDSEGLMSR